MPRISLRQVERILSFPPTKVEKLKKARLYENLMSKRGTYGQVIAQNPLVKWLFPPNAVRDGTILRLGALRGGVGYGEYRKDPLEEFFYLGKGKGYFIESEGEEGRKRALYLSEKRVVGVAPALLELLDRLSSPLKQNPNLRRAKAVPLLDEAVKKSLGTSSAGLKTFTKAKALKLAVSWKNPVLLAQVGYEIALEVARKFEEKMKFDIHEDFIRLSSLLTPGARYEPPSEPSPRQKPPEP